MKVCDIESWQGRRAALVQDGEIGQTFLAFLESWAEYAERVIDAREDLSPVAALERAFPVIEIEYGRTGINFLGQMMAVLAEHWVYGEALMDSVSPLVRRLIEDMTLLKLIDEMQKAETHGNENENQDGDSIAGSHAELFGVQSGGQDPPDQTAASGT